MPSPPFDALSGIRQIYACLGKPRRSSKSLQLCCKDSPRLSVTPRKRRKVELREVSARSWSAERFLAMSILLRAAVSFLTVVGGLFIVPASAASVCQGSYTASSIRSLPQPATIELGVTRSDPANLRLAEVFADGLRRAGVTVT